MDYDCIYIFKFCALLPAAQKARDAFDEAEKALQEVDDQIK